MVAKVFVDGIDPSGANNVYIHDCIIENGDDNVAVKANSSNVLVERCSFIGGRGATIGSVQYVRAFTSAILFPRPYRCGLFEKLILSVFSPSASAAKCCIF